MLWLYSLCLRSTSHLPNMMFGASVDQPSWGSESPLPLSLPDVSSILTGTASRTGFLFSYAGWILLHRFVFFYVTGFLFCYSACTHRRATIYGHRSHSPRIPMQNLLVVTSSYFSLGSDSKIRNQRLHMTSRSCIFVLHVN